MWQLDVDIFKTPFSAPVLINSAILKSPDYVVVANRDVKSLHVPWLASDWLEAQLETMPLVPWVGLCKSEPQMLTAHYVCVWVE